MSQPGWMRKASLALGGWPLVKKLCSWPGRVDTCRIRAHRPISKLSRNRERGLSFKAWPFVSPVPTLSACDGLHAAAV